MLSTLEFTCTSPALQWTGRCKARCRLFKAFTCSPALHQGAVLLSQATDSSITTSGEPFLAPLRTHNVTKPITKSYNHHHASPLRTSSSHLRSSTVCPEGFPAPCLPPQILHKQSLDYWSSQIACLSRSKSQPMENTNTPCLRVASYRLSVDWPRR